MDKRLVTILLLGIFLFSFVSAEGFFSQQPSDTYNYGDTLEAVIGTDGSEGWVNVDLSCNNATNKLVFFHHMSQGEVEADITVPLTKSFLRNLKGDCFLTLDFNGDKINSLGFRVDDQIDLDVSFDKKVFDPNETIYFSGSSHKLNNGEINGFVEITFSYESITIITPIVKGGFSGNLSLPNNIPAGNYTLGIFAYEKNLDGEITNFGRTSTTIDVIQRPNTLTITVAERITPGDDLSFLATLTDQARNTIDLAQVAFILKDTNENVIFTELGATGTESYYKMRKNAVPGFWNLTAEAEGIITDGYVIYVDENKEATFNMVNNTLIIRNVGNVPYDNFVEIRIGNYTEIKNLNLSLTKSVEFELSAPDGNYTIEVTDGGLDFTTIAPLTGNAIRIKDARYGGVGFFSGNFLAWFFVIGVLGMFVFVSSKKVMNKKFVLSMKNFPKLKKKSHGGVVKVTPGKEGDNVGVASHTIAINGEKQKASFISLKIRNQEEINKGKSNSHDSISDAIKLITDHKGKVYKSGDYVIGIFSPVMTKTFDNEFTSIKIAQEISHNLKEHNKKYVQKIHFGIASGDGEIIAKKENQDLLFTPVGNGLIAVKKMSDHSKGNVLLNEALNKKLGNKIKTSKEELGDYSIAEISDHSKDSQFIKRFLERNDYKK